MRARKNDGLSELKSVHVPNPVKMLFDFKKWLEAVHILVNYVSG